MGTIAEVAAKIKLTVRPIDVWPGSRRSGMSCPYRAGLADTLKILKFELAELKAKDIVLQVAVREGDMRLDGLPRADAKFEHPGIVLSFDSKEGVLTIFFNEFRNWEDNLRAIAMHMQHLRLAVLYGVGRDGRVYAGWKALPAPTEESSGFASADAAIEWLASFLWEDAGLSPSYFSSALTDYEFYRSLRRRVAAILHPDVTGNAADFKRLADVDAIVEAHFRSKETSNA